MKRISTSLILVLLVLFASLLVSGWGFWGHKRINKMAVFTLPSEMMGFYKRNLTFVEEHSVDPDKRRYAVKEEAPRHYIDLDHYGKNPFDSIPQFWNEAVDKYTEDTLQAYGIVPWHVVRILQSLTDAFSKKDAGSILHLSSDIGHYIADAHVPLHCTENYNGQLTNQTGLHGFWESRLPEMYGNEYDYLAGKAVYIENPQKIIWSIIRESYGALDSVLGFEKALNDKFPPDKKYSIEQRGAYTAKVYSQEYAAAYNEMLSGMVERRMKQSIINVGSFWYTAWRNAGSPSLDGIENAVIPDSLKKQMEEEDKLWRTGKIVNSKGHDD